MTWNWDWRHISLWTIQLSLKLSRNVKPVKLSLLCEWVNIIVFWQQNERQRPKDKGNGFSGRWLLLCFCKSVIRPVAEYACPAWHSSMTVEHSNRIESFQKRALKIIYNDFTSGDNAYAFTCILADLPQLAERREQLTRRLSVKMAGTDNCLNYLLPAKRDSEIISSLRTAKEYPLICAKSTRFKKSFLPYALSNYQWSYRCNCAIVYSSSHMHVSIQLLSYHTNKPVYWLTDSLRFVRCFLRNAER